jgi:adenylate kinase
MENSNKILTIIFLGKAGSGKGTQVQWLKEKLRAEVIESGSLLRAYAAEDNLAAKKLKYIIDGGALAPTWLVQYFWKHALLHPAHQLDNIVFDGSPRMMPEAIEIDTVLDFLDRIPPKVIYLDITDQEAEKRLLGRKNCSNPKCKKIYPLGVPELETNKCSVCGYPLFRREDDNPEGIRNRLAYFQKEVMPVIQHYKEKGWLIDVNGGRSIEEIHRDILDHLNIEKK